MDALRAILAGLIVLAVYGLIGASDVQEEAAQAAREASWPMPAEGDVEDF
jgi:hypothetical protein